jgi:hypothetical protein
MLHYERDAEVSADFLPSLEYIVCPYFKLMCLSVDQHVRAKDRRLAHPWRAGVSNPRVLNIHLKLSCFESAFY